MTNRCTASSSTLPETRRAVRDALLGSSEFENMDGARRAALARSLVKVADHAAALLVEEAEADARIQRDRTAAPATALANAGDELGLQSTQQVARTTRDVLRAVSFPRFVEELINGVFKAMVGSTIRQMDSYIELLDNVSASTESFDERNVGDDRARQWLADTYPAAFEVGSENDELTGFDDDPSVAPTLLLRRRAGASFPDERRLREDLGLAPGDPVPAGDPERLVPLARRKLARGRQEMLASLVMLGLQRIIVDEGSIKAGMRFHVDARSAAHAERGNRFDFQNQIAGSGSFGVGPWGASASMSNTIGYVRTSQTQTSEEIDTDLTLDSSVEIRFRSDQVPLDHLASQAQADRVRAHSRNPTSVVATATPTGRSDERRAAEAARREQTAAQLRPSDPASRVRASSEARTESGGTVRSSAGDGQPGSASATAPTPRTPTTRPPDQPSRTDTPQPTSEPTAQPIGPTRPTNETPTSPTTPNREGTAP